MLKKLTTLISIFAIASVFSCTATMNEVNKGAEEAGKTGGQVLRVPNSVSEGVAEGISGEQESNPYER